MRAQAEAQQASRERQAAEADVPQLSDPVKVKESVPSGRRVPALAAFVLGAALAGAVFYGSLPEPQPPIVVQAAKPKPAAAPSATALFDGAAMVLKVDPAFEKMPEEKAPN